MAAFSATTLSLVVLCVASLTLLHTIPSAAKSVLYSGQQLKASQSLSAGNLKFKMFNNCEAALIEGKQHLWSTHTRGKGIGCHLDMQSDGNLVLYDKDYHVIWASLETEFPTGYYSLVLNSDKTLVVYNSNHIPVWTSENNV